MVTLPDGSTQSSIQSFFLAFQLKWFFSTSGQTISVFFTPAIWLAPLTPIRTGTVQGWWRNEHNWISDS
jgi:hypothetical protein